MKKYLIANPFYGLMVLCLLALALPISGIWKGYEQRRLFDQWQEKHPNIQVAASDSSLMAYNRVAFFLKTEQTNLSLAVAGLKSILASNSVSDQIRGFARYNLSQVEQRQAEGLKEPERQVEQLKLAIAGYRDAALWLDKGAVYQNNQTALAQALIRLSGLQKQVDMQEYTRLRSLEPDQLVDELERLSNSEISAADKERKQQMILGLIQQKTASYPFYTKPPS